MQKFDSLVACQSILVFLRLFEAGMVQLRDTNAVSLVIILALSMCNAKTMQVQSQRLVFSIPMVNGVLQTFFKQNFKDFKQLRHKFEELSSGIDIADGGQIRACNPELSPRCLA